MDYKGYYEGTLRKTAGSRMAFLSKFSKTCNSLICVWERDPFSHTFHLCLLKKERLFPRKVLCLICPLHDQDSKK